MTMAKNGVNLSFIEYLTSQSHVNLENLNHHNLQLFCYKYNKILIYQPQCYMIYGEVNNQMFNTKFQYNY